MLKNLLRPVISASVLIALSAGSVRAQTTETAPAKLPDLDYLLHGSDTDADTAVGEPAPPASSSGDAAPALRSPSEIEESVGGRMGVALVTAEGKVVLGFNRDERFAMCSTFKAPLAAAIMSRVGEGRIDPQARVSFGPQDILDYAPVVKDNAEKGMLPVETLAKGAVEVSDNSAANLLLPLVGGPEGLTAFMRAHGDTITRLDRTEPTLNENAQDDPRDTTSPAAMAGLMARLIFTDLKADQAATLRSWLEASPTGARRIRAGLPEGWSAGDKTGTCGNAVNDVAVLKAPDGREYVLAVYIDRPTVETKEAEAAIAEVTRAAIGMLGNLRQKAGPTAR